VRGKDMFDRIVRNVSAFTTLQRDEGIDRPLVSLWLTGLKETIDQLPEFVRLAHRTGVSEVHLQRLVFTPEGKGLARARSALFEQLEGEEPKRLEEAAEFAERLGIHFNASGATEAGTSLKRAADDQPWSLCRRPWTLMYFTAHGRAIPCCIAPFSLRGYDGFTLGDAAQESLRQIWNGPRYQQFRRELLSDAPPPACASCGVRWSL
jgi:MoaA/NifB/PqqE/SkfB family radical SAM enzyme